jgi:hypothetical protein
MRIVVVAYDCVDRSQAPGQKAGDHCGTDHEKTDKDNPEAALQFVSLLHASLTKCDLDGFGGNAAQANRIKPSKTTALALALGIERLVMLRNFSAATVASHDRLHLLQL